MNPTTLLLPWLVSALTTLSAAERIDRYDVHVEPSSNRLVVDASFEGLEGRSGLSLKMIDKFAFTALPEPLLDGPLTAETEARESLRVTRDSPYEWTVDRGRAPVVNARWVVPMTHRELPAVLNRSAYEFPYLEDDHGMIVCGATFMMSLDDESIRRVVRFHVPEGWPVLAPWPERDGWLEVDDQRSFLNNLVAVGAWSKKTVSVHEAEVDIAFAPGQDRLQEMVVDRIAEIVEAELDLFDHRPFERYLVLFGRPDMPGFAGSVKAGGMTLAVAPQLVNPGVDSYVNHLIAHEFHHTWAMSRFEFSGDLRFYMEGFTDYYARLVPSRLGHASWSAFAEAVGAALSAWEQSPVVDELSLVDAGGPRFFTERPVLRLTYDGGLALAALLDVELRTVGTNLDQVMREFNNDERWSLDGDAPDLDDLVAAAARHLGDERATALFAVASRPGFPDAVQLFGDAGRTLGRKVTPAKLDLRANLDQTTLKGIDTADAGFRLGLRTGDELVRVNGVEVASPGEIYRAWKAPVEGRVQVTYRRGGEVREIDAEIPEEVRYVLDPGEWVHEG